MTSRYATAAFYSGSPLPVLDAAITALAHQGFEILERSDQHATLIGPGLNSSRQNPVLGATKVVLKATAGKLHMDAELGGVDRMRAFLMRFPFLLGLGLGLSFAVTGGLAMGRQAGIGFGVPWAPAWQWVLAAAVAGMLPTAPWLVLSPLMARKIRERTQRALDVLVRNATLSPSSAA